MNPTLKSVLILVLVVLALKGIVGMFQSTTTPAPTPPATYTQKVEAALSSLPPPKTETPKCNPNYSGCLKPDASDYDCAGGSGNGPYYTGMVRVLGYDEYGLDRDGDGIACE